LIELFFLNSIIHTNTYPSNLWQKKTQVNFLSGACIAFSRKTLNKLGGLDEHLFWMDDVDLCKRNSESGGKCYYFPATTIRHFIGQSSKKNQRVVISNQIISKLKYYKKHQQTFNFLSSVVIFVLQILTRIPLFAALGIFNPFYFKKASAYVYSLKKMFNFLFLNEQAVI
jgi:GT2 family glycosyltransferase